jgi:hypothetical protein
MQPMMAFYTDQIGQESDNGGSIRDKSFNR